MLPICKIQFAEFKCYFARLGGAFTQGKNKLKVLLSFDIRLEINTEICFDPKKSIVKRL